MIRSIGSEDRGALVCGEKMTGLGKVYVWSVIFEPLLFFIVADQSVSGVTGNISRLLQATVLAGIALKLLKVRSFSRVPNPLGRDYWIYTLFILLALLSGIYGAITGAYQVGNAGSDVKSGSVFSLSNLNSSLIRPLFEYFIYIYFFVYFVILPRYLIYSRSGINYFFTVFTFCFFISFLAGLIDLISAQVFGLELIPRHISDGRYVGARFHGFAGEPRDAFVYLGSGFVILALRDYWTGKKQLTIIRKLAILFAAIMTKSASGIIGLAIAASLIGANSLKRLSVKWILITFVIFTGLFIVGYLGAKYGGARIQNYLDGFEVLYDVLEHGNPVPPAIGNQIQNIYPLWQRWLDIRSFEFVNVMLGTGLGSSSVINKTLGGFEDAVVNPNSEIIRIFYECGVIGTLVFIISFIKPIQRYATSKAVQIEFTTLMLLMIGLFLGHRSAALYIVFGMVLTVLRYKSELSKTEKQFS